MSSGDDEDDIPYHLAIDDLQDGLSAELARRKLSAATMALLGDFYSEREQNEQRFENLKAHTEDNQLRTPLSMSMFTEDWNASQFWVNTSIVPEKSHFDALSTAMRQPSFLPNNFSETLQRKPGLQ